MCAPMKTASPIGMPLRLRGGNGTTFKGPPAAETKRMKVESTNARITQYPIFVEPHQCLFSTDKPCMSQQLGMLVR